MQNKQEASKKLPKNDNAKCFLLVFAGSIQLPAHTDKCLGFGSGFKQCLESWFCFFFTGR